MVSLGATSDSFPGRLRRGMCLGEEKVASSRATHLRRRYLAASVWAGDHTPLPLCFLALKHGQQNPAREAHRSQHMQGRTKP